MVASEVAAVAARCHKEGRRVAGGSSQPCVHSEVG